MSTNYHTPIPAAPAQPEATSELFNSRFSDLDSGISGKVDSAGNGSNITSEVSVAGTRRNLTSGGALKVIFSEIQKWLSDMKAVAFSASYNDLIDQPTAMTPTTHAATHKTGGSDALKAVDIGAVSDVLPGSNVTVSKNPDTGAVTINAAGGGSGGSAHIIANDGAALPNQGTLDFGTGLTAADDQATFKTAVTLDMGVIQIGKAQIKDFPTAMTPTAHKDTHKTDGSDAITPADIGAMVARPIIIEMGGTGWTGGVIDFHFGNSTEDFTTRLEESAPGRLNIKGKTSGTSVLSVDGDIISNNTRDIGRIALPLAAGWMANSPLPTFRKVGRLVELSGIVTAPSNAADGAIIGTLPAGYRPAASKRVPIVTSLGIGRIDIEPDGAIKYRKILSSNPVYVDFSCVMFHIN